MTDSRKIAIYLRLSIEDDALDGKASTEQAGKATVFPISGKCF